MVRPAPPTIGQGNWGGPLLNALDYATDTAEEALSAASAANLTANSAASAVAAKADASHTHNISQVTNLQSNLDAKAADNAVVKLTGNQTIAGTKTFSSAPVVPDASFSQAKVSGLSTALSGKLTDASGQTTRWRGIYANEASLPSDGQPGDFAITLE